MKKPVKTKPKQATPSKRLMSSKSRFSLPTLLAAVVFLVIVGFLVVRSFAANAPSNPWDCSAPYPTIQHGTSDNSGGRTDHCVSAVQWAFVNSYSLMQYIGYTYNFPAIDGRYDPDRNIIDGNDYLWWPIVYLQRRRGQAQTGILTPEQVAFVATYSPFKTPVLAPAPQPAGSPPPPPAAPPSEPDYGTSSDGTGYDAAPSVFQQLNDISLDDIAKTDSNDLQKLIDQSMKSAPQTSAGLATDQLIPRVFSGVLRIVPSSDDLSSGGTEFRYYVDGKLSEKAKQKPYAFTLDTSRLKDGRHILTIVAYNGGERLTESSYALTTKNRLNFWQQLYNLLTAPFYGWF